MCSLWQPASGIRGRVPEERDPCYSAGQPSRSAGSDIRYISQCRGSHHTGDISYPRDKVRQSKQEYPRRNSIACTSCSSMENLLPFPWMPWPRTSSVQIFATFLAFETQISCRGRGRTMVARVNDAHDSASHRPSISKMLRTNSGSG